MNSRSLTCATIDNSFGPYAQGCRGGLDFTLLFEETILSILPLSILILVAPFRIFYLLRKQTKVLRSHLLPLKLVCIDMDPSLQLLWHTYCRVIDSDIYRSLRQRLRYSVLYKYPYWCCGQVGPQ